LVRFRPLSVSVFDGKLAFNETQLNANS